MLALCFDVSEQFAYARRGKELCATYPSSTGSEIFEETRPLSVSAALITPSVPAEYNVLPSPLNASVLQLPLCLRVRHAVPTVPKPSSELLRPRIVKEVLRPPLVVLAPM